MVSNIPTMQSTDARGPVAAESGRYLTFTLNDESYALDIFHVIEILEYRNLTVVPMMPEFIRGVINLRGRAVPVIDLAIRFTRGATVVKRRTSIIIVHINEPVVTGDDDSGTAESGGQDIGILVDAVGRKGYLLAVSLFWVGFPYALMSLTHNFWMLLVCVTLVGIGNPSK